MTGIHFNTIHAYADIALAVIILLVFLRTILIAIVALKEGRVDMTAFRPRVLFGWSLLALLSAMTGGIFTSIALLVMGGARHTQKAAY